MSSAVVARRSPTTSHVRSPRHWSRLGFAVAAVLAAASLAAPRAGRADPPGFPSTPGAAAPTPPAVGPQSADEVAKFRVTALKKFVRDKEADPVFAEHEGPERACQIDHDKGIVTLTFNADGTLHCKVTEIAEGYQIEVYVLTVKNLYSAGNHYRVTVTPGAPLKTVPIHGTSDDVKAELAVLSGLHAEYTEAAWWHASNRFGPYHFDSGTVTVFLDEAAVCEQTKLAITPLYRFNLTVVALAGTGVPTYSIADGKIAQSKNSVDLGYYLGVHAYPFSWHGDGKGHHMPGRYFSDDYGEWYDRISLLVGINLAHPTEAGFVGGAIEVYSGVSITGGWQPRKYQRLQSGNNVGDMIMGDTVPTDSVWKLDGWGIGLSMDATLLKTVLAFVGK
jgi:hypothetical protein